MSGSVESIPRIGESYARLGGVLAILTAAVCPHGARATEPMRQLFCVFSVLDPCRMFSLVWNENKASVRPASRKCLQFYCLMLTWIFLAGSAQPSTLDDAKNPSLEFSQPPPGAFSAPPCLKDAKVHIDRLVSANNSLKAALDSDPNKTEFPSARDSNTPGESNRAESKTDVIERCGSNRNEASPGSEPSADYRDCEAFVASASADRVAARQQGVTAYAYTAAATACWVACAYPPARPSCAATSMAAEAVDRGASLKAYDGTEPCAAALRLTTWSTEHLRGMSREWGLYRGMYSQALSENVRRVAAETLSALEATSTAIQSCMRKSQ